MSTAMSTVEEVEVCEPENTEDCETQDVIPISQFIDEFGEGLLDAVQQQNPPVYDGVPNPYRDRVMQSLRRKPFPAQAGVVQAIAALLEDEGEHAAIINAEMGTGKTMMSIALAAVLSAKTWRRNLIICPPHLVYKWRREINETIDGARVWILNGPDTLAKLLMLRDDLGVKNRDNIPEFFIMGRVRMRMGFHWKPAFSTRFDYQRRQIELGNTNSKTYLKKVEYVSCPRCGVGVTSEDAEGNPLLVKPVDFPDSKRLICQQCMEPLWTLVHPTSHKKTRKEMVMSAMCQIPTIGKKTAEKLVAIFGEDLLGGMLADNVYEFINLMDDEGELVFTDKQAKRMERAMANLEISFGQGGYQPTEFIKRYLPDKYFGLMIVDEGHEYKNDNSAQGQAMGVLASKVDKVVLLTGTLMGGYADDLFYLLWRVLTKRMMEDGYVYNSRGSLGTASLAFMREHGILKDIYSETEGDSHRTAKGKRITMRTVKAPGFGPKGIARYVLPYTAFLKLKDIGGNVLPDYQEHFIDVPMSDEQQDIYNAMSSRLRDELKTALRKGDTSLLGVVLNVLLAWPDCCFREETVKHPRTHDVLFYSGSVFDDEDAMPKEDELINLCKDEKKRGRKVLVYTVYTGKRDTAARLKAKLQQEGLKVSVLRASVSTSKREDWILDQVDRGIDVLITNPELVKTGLDLLDFPTIAFMQTGYNVYTLLQASRRSWRIGQQQDVSVYFFGYADTAQMPCLELMSKKITVSQSTSGDVPDSGLDVLNPDGDSMEVALAKQLLNT